jgi:hypothetical protein
MKDLRLPVATLLAVAVLAASAGISRAHSPTGVFSSGWQSGGGLSHSVPSYFHWSGFSTTPDLQVRDGVEAALEVGWANSATNNSKGMLFASSASGPATVFFSTTTDVDACNAYTHWQGCAILISPSDGTWKIWIHKGDFPFCENSLASGCRLAERIAIHETGHIGGSLTENEDIQANTVMQSVTGAPTYPKTGWDTTTERRCDEARLQIRYDVRNLAGPYADCFDHVTNHGTFGMVTDLTEAPASYTACSGDVVTVSGRLQIHAGHYGREYTTNVYELDANPLSGRVISIDRNGGAYTSATADATSGDDWSKAISSTVISTVTYTYSAQFDRTANTTAMVTGLDSSPSRSFTITWVAGGAC